MKYLLTIFMGIFSVSAAVTGCQKGDAEHHHSELEESIDHAIFEAIPEIKSDQILINIEDLIDSDVCSTQPALPLSIQIAEELSCEHPNLFQSIEHIEGLNFALRQYLFSRSPGLMHCARQSRNWESIFG